MILYILSFNINPAMVYFEYVDEDYVLQPRICYEGSKWPRLDIFMLQNKLLITKKGFQILYVWSL